MKILFLGNSFAVDTAEHSVNIALSMGNMTLISTLSRIDAASACWCPDGVDEYAKKVAIESVRNAQKHPLTITYSNL